MKKIIYLEDLEKMLNALDELHLESERKAMEKKESYREMFEFGFRTALKELSVKAYSITEYQREKETISEAV